MEFESTWTVTTFRNISVDNFVLTHARTSHSLALCFMPSGADWTCRTQETGLTNQGKFSAAFGSPFILRERQLFSEPDVPPVARAGQELAGSTPCRSSSKPVDKHQRTASIWATQDVPGVSD
jgi:hypothetical protein